MILCFFSKFLRTIKERKRIDRSWVAFRELVVDKTYVVFNFEKRVVWWKSLMICIFVICDVLARGFVFLEGESFCCGGFRGFRAIFRREIGRSS